MSFQGFQETLIASQVDSTALTASTTPTTILPTAAVYTVPANFMAIGRRLRLTAWGRISTVVTTPGTLTLDVRFGSVVVANGAAMALNIVAKTNVGWFLQWDLVCRAIGGGTSANMMHQGIWSSEAVIGSPLPSVGGAGCHMLPISTAPAVGTGFDSTASQAVNLFATWSLNNANSILTHQYTLESLN